MTEKRRHTRVALDVSMNILAAGQETAKCRGKIADFSPGGMAFRTDAELEKGMCLHLKFGAPAPLEIRGEIRSTTNGKLGGLNRYGIHFHKIGYQETTLA